MANAFVVQKDTNPLHGLACKKFPIVRKCIYFDLFAELFWCSTSTPFGLHKKHFLLISYSFITENDQNAP
jgi:hypothetical protein